MGAKLVGKCNLQLKTFYNIYKNLIVISKKEKNMSNKKPNFIVFLTFWASRCLQMRAEASEKAWGRSLTKPDPISNESCYFRAVFAGAHPNVEVAQKWSSIYSTPSPYCWLSYGIADWL